MTRLRISLTNTEGKAIGLRTSLSEAEETIGLKGSLTEAEEKTSLVEHWVLEAIFEVVKAFQRKEDFC